MTSRRARGASGTRPPTTPPRDQFESAFAAILGALVARVPGARAAALVDRDGETVDYAGQGNPFELRVAAAHLRIVLDQTTAQPSLSRVRSVVIRAARGSFIVRALPDGYALVLRLARGAGFRGEARALPHFSRLLAEEAGWARERHDWYAVEVLIDERGLPSALHRGGHDEPLELLGRFRAALPQRERAWRVRLQTGVETTLLRESGGAWYADERV